jgi:small subunit ribosomal protein S6
MYSLLLPEWIRQGLGFAGYAVFGNVAKITNPKGGKMNLYEKVMILDSRLDDSAVEETVEKVKDRIIKQGGEILKTENWGTRKLAYELNKHQKGNYVILLFKAPPSTIMELERFCRLTDAIIKIMVVKLQKKKQIEAVLASLTETGTDSKAEGAESAEGGKTTASDDTSLQEDKKGV